MERIKACAEAYLLLSARKKALLWAVIVLLLVLVIALCISTNMRSNIQREYAAARSKVGESLFSNLYMLTQTFDMVSVPNADVQNVILPQMKQYYIASSTLNEVLGRAYGQRYVVLTESDIQSIDSAFEAYAAAFQSGSSTDLAQSNMQSCVTRIRELLSTRYSEGVLKASR